MINDFLCKIRHVNYERFNEYNLLKNSQGMKEIIISGANFQQIKENKAHFDIFKSYDRCKFLCEYKK